MNRLQTITLLPGLPGETLRSVTYDPMDNILTLDDPDSALTFTYDVLNRQETADTTGAPFQPAVTLTYGYDANGNRTSLDDGLFSATTYLYDAVDRLISLDNPAVGPITFAYDGLNRRTAMTRPNGVDTAFTYDPASRLDTLTHDLSGTVISAFDYGLDAVGERTRLGQVRSTLAVTASLAYG